MDDGWNAYPWEYENKTGFWTWNTKFPNGLAKPKDLMDRISSTFGLWLGPRGGYGRPGEFAKYLA